MWFMVCNNQGCLDIFIAQSNQFKSNSLLLFVCLYDPILHFLNFVQTFLESVLCSLFSVVWFKLMYFEQVMNIFFIYQIFLVHSHSEQVMNTLPKPGSLAMDEMNGCATDNWPVEWVNLLSQREDHLWGHQACLQGQWRGEESARWPQAHFPTNRSATGEWHARTDHRPRHTAVASRTRHLSPTLPLLLSLLCSAGLAPSVGMQMFAESVQAGIERDRAEQRSDLWTRGLLPKLYNRSTGLSLSPGSSLLVSQHDSVKKHPEKTPPQVWLHFWPGCQRLAFLWFGDRDTSLTRSGMRAESSGPWTCQMSKHFLLISLKNNCAK